ncbi:MAG: hypothetical protein AAGP08_08840 [Pseudomonadota bacterium]
MMLSPRDLMNRAEDALPQIDVPSLGKEVALPVYVVHNSRDAEDYFFIFDFEHFVEGTRAGWFVRPKLTLWAGRSDFARSRFARQFRESFAREFDIARAQLAAQEAKPQGWFGYLSTSVRDLRGRSLSDLVANIVLLVATSTGKAVLRHILPQGWLSAKSDAAKLEDGIETTRAQVDAALMNLDIRLHPELYAHAYRDGPQGRNADLDRAAWPLPAYVRQHLHDQTGGAWW